jgi:hypothetical protein
MRWLLDPVKSIKFGIIYTVVAVFPHDLSCGQIQCVDLKGLENPFIKNGRFGAEWFELAEEQ